MNVFISFSGDRSVAVAEALRDWLPGVIQAAEPWMSHRDIQKGTQWAGEVSGVLAQCSVGIICITPENVHEPWIAFEAGALSKTLLSARVCPYLFDMNVADLPYPLAMFQAAKATMADTRKLVSTINAGLGTTPLDEQRLDKAFEKWWPSLDGSLAKIPTAFVTDKSVRPDRELLEELVALVRGQTSERRDQEMINRIHGFHAVLKELDFTVRTSGGRTPEVERRLRALRAELEQARSGFEQLFESMGDSSTSSDPQDIQLSVDTDLPRLR